MAIRTTSSDVQTLLGGNYDGETDLDAFAIASATVIVDRMNTCAGEQGFTITTAELELIERWLSAHMYTMQDRMSKSESTLKASINYVDQTGMNLEETTFGRMAIMIDPSGCLKQISKKDDKVGAVWLGKVPSAQTDYKDRD